MRRWRAVVGVALGILIGAMAMTPAGAEASPDGVDADPRIVEMMEAVPGGVLVDADHAVWPALDMEMTVPTGSNRSAHAVVGPCADGRVCVFSGHSLNGSSLSWGVCGSQTIPPNFVAKSLAHARASGSTQARNGTTPVATAYAGGSTNIYGTVTNIRCFL